MLNDKCYKINILFHTNFLNLKTSENDYSGWIMLK